MNIKNLSLSLVATAPTPATTGTSLVLESGTGSRFPNTDDESFYVTAMPPGENPHIENSEILKVIDITGDTITMVREQRGSTAKSIGVGWIIVNGVYAEDVSGILEALDALNIEGDPDNKVTTTLNENDFASDSATALATQKSIKSYVDNVAETLSSADGWISANENWTYSSATEITVPSGATSKYQKGDKIKLTQGTVKYFYIIKVVDTTLTITAGSNYTLVNSAITENYYSKIENPQGFPTSFTVANPVLTAGGSLTWTLVSVSRANLKIIGDTAILHYSIKGSLGGSANFLVYATWDSGVIPTPSVEESGSCMIINNSTAQLGRTRLNTSRRLEILRYDRANYAVDNLLAEGSIVYQF